MQKKFAGNIILKLLSVLVSVFAVIAIAGGIARVVLNDDTLTLASLVNRIISGKSIIQKNSAEQNTLIASTEESSVEISNPNTRIKMQVAAADKNQWPKDVVGGLYKLDPSQDSFEQPLSFKIKLKKDPGPWFSLGYWHPEYGRWEWLSTVRTGDGIYETVLLHASYVGGGTAGDYEPDFRDGGNQDLANDANAELQKIEREGVSGKNEGGSWEEIWKIMKDLTDKAIGDLCAKKNAQSIHDFFAAWEMVQQLNFNSLDARFYRTFTTDCEKKKDKIGYEIVQVDYYDIDINLDIAQGMYKLNSKNKTETVSTGWTKARADESQSAFWKTEWEVYQGSTVVSDINQRFYEEYRSPYSYALMDINGKTSGEGKGLQVLTFNLANVQEGGNFPIRMVTESGLLFRTTDHSLNGLAIIKNEDGTFRWQKSDNRGFNEDFGNAAPIVLTGTLLKDNGDQGAIVGFSEQYFTPEQLAQVKQLQAIAKNGPAELQNLWGANGKPNFMSGDLTPKPLLIKRSAPEEEKNKEEDDYKEKDSELQSQRERDRKDAEERENEKENDKDGDGLPDLAPLGIIKALK